MLTVALARLAVEETAILPAAVGVMLMRAVEAELSVNVPCIDNVPVGSPGERIPPVLVVAPTEPVPPNVAPAEMATVEFDSEPSMMRLPLCICTGPEKAAWLSAVTVTAPVLPAGLIDKVPSPLKFPPKVPLKLCSILRVEPALMVMVPVSDRLLVFPWRILLAVMVVPPV